MKVLISTAPFGSSSDTPIRLMEDAGIDFTMNPFGRKMTEAELAKIISGFECLIAGTEKITRRVLANASGLKLIARVGIGLDGVDLIQAREQKIQVSYTPDAPSPAVAELTIALMISTLRSVQISNQEMHNRRWERFFGRRLSESVIGIIGVGRIGSRVIEHLAGFGCRNILANDLDPSIASRVPKHVKMVDKEQIYQGADVISIHVPLTGETKGMIGKDQFQMFKKDSVLINTARGGIVEEDALKDALVENRILAAAVDTFEDEPYKGPLCDIKHCLLTSHMGSMSEDCRERMELEATQEVIRLSQGAPLMQEVPELEYQIQDMLLSAKGV
jgi:D-3-phosphoglycerate dehydrogenase / 2-oxoglutarate reductase